MALHAVLPRTHRPRGGGPLAVLVTFLLAVVTLLAMAAPAGAAPGASGPATPEEIGKALRERPVYVDEGARGRLGAAGQRALSERIGSAGEPVYIVVLPKDAAYHQSTVISDIREATGRAGVYGVLLGDQFGAAADTSLMPGDRARDLARETERRSGGVDAAALTGFADRAAASVGEGAGGTSGGAGRADTGGSGAVGMVLGVLLLGGMAAAVLFVGRGAVRARREEAAELARVKATVDEDVTSYGEELDRLDFAPSAPGGASPEENEALVAEYGAALDAYEEAKAAMARVRTPRDVREVTSALEGGRFALATLRARRAGEPLPEHRAPCFFDPRHGPSVEDREWSPEGGAPRPVPVCAADAARLDGGEPPMARHVETAGGRRPYWEAGPAYGPWAGGFFGGYGTTVVSGMLIGTMLGSAMGAGTAWADDGGGYGGDGFGGGGFDGGFGGGGFGGGGGFDGGF
ncbi:hypothetical protein ACWGJ2_31600 [Streptomyces sp. NPDC054796]